MTPEDIILACKAHLKKKLQRLCRTQRKRIIRTLEKLAISAATLSVHFDQAPPVVHADTAVTRLTSPLTSITTTNTTDYCQDHFDQQHISHTQFDGKNLIPFRNDFLTTMLLRHQWSNLIQITAKSGAQKNVLHDFMSITEDNIQLAKASHSAQENTAAFNMYVSLWSLFDKKVKMLMQSKAEQHTGDGLALLYYTLCKYTVSAETIICNQLQQLHGLPTKFKEYQYNVTMFCD
eukprot:450858-Ditylum_brightwellii.AAC.1